MKSLLKIALVLIAGILIYNFFFGTSEEKAQSREVFKKTGDAIGATWNLLKSEKAKFDAGKYDKVLEQLGGAYRAVRERAKFVDEKVIKRLDELEARKHDIQAELDAIEQAEQQLQAAPLPAPSNKKTATKPNAQTSQKAAEQQRRKEELLRSLDSLIRDTNTLLQEAQQGN